MRLVVVRHQAIGAQAHLMLLAALITVLAVQPIFARTSGTVALISDTAIGVICLLIFLTLCQERWERHVGLVLFLLVLVANGAVSALGGPSRDVAAFLFQAALVLFLGFAIVVVVRLLTRTSIIHVRDVLGAVGGYILAALAWSHLYALTYMLVPSAFSVSPDIAAQLQDWRLRRTLLDHLSFTTLTSIGYSDITPVGSPLYALMWTETIFGQFYMAVVVAQLVGLKLAQSLKSER